MPAIKVARPDERPKKATHSKTPANADIDSDDQSILDDSMKDQDWDDAANFDLNYESSEDEEKAKESKKVAKKENPFRHGRRPAMLSDMLQMEKVTKRKPYSVMAEGWTTEVFGSNPLTLDREDVAGKVEKKRVNVSLKEPSLDNSKMIFCS